LNSARRLDNKLNVFEDICRNLYFLAISLVIIIGQMLIIFFGGSALSAVRLTATQWAISLILGFLSIPVGVVVRLIPDGIFPIRVDDKLWVRIQARDDRFIWNEAIESVRSEFASFQQPRSSRLDRLQQSLPNVGKMLAALKGMSLGWPSPEREVDDETSPILRPELHSDGGRSRSNSTIAPAAVLAGIVAGSVAGWSPVEADAPRAW
jgi:P-type Ca2+ transporter type 2C